jgi:divalent metal cation (Fe/Co/Zn/Cd) transporter
LKTYVNFTIYLSFYCFFIPFFSYIFTKSLALASITIYNAYSLVIAFLYIYVAKKIEIPKDNQHHFGFFKLEPLMITLEGVVILTTCVFSAFLALQHIRFLKIHYIEEPHIELILTLISLLIYGFVWKALTSF